MRKRHADRQRRRAQEFEAFVAGAAGRLLHTTALLTAEGADTTDTTEAPDASGPARPADTDLRAARLLTAALARTYADWDRLRGEDPYDRTRQDVATRFAHTAWRHHRPRGGRLAGLTPHERLVLVLRLYEGVSEEQTAALLGLPADRVRAICARAVSTMRNAARSPARSSEHPPARPSESATARSSEPATAVRVTAGRGSDPDPPDRRTDEVRRMLEGPHPPVPAGLEPRAAAYGARLLRRRRAVNRLWTWTMWTAAVVLLLWIVVTQPWVDPPAGTTPPLDGW